MGWFFWENGSSELLNCWDSFCVTMARLCEKCELLFATRKERHEAFENYFLTESTENTKEIATPIRYRSFSKEWQDCVKTANFYLPQRKKGTKFLKTWNAWLETWNQQPVTFKLATFSPDSSGNPAGLKAPFSWLFGATKEATKKT